MWRLNFAETKTKTSVFYLKFISTIIKYTTSKKDCLGPIFFSHGDIHTKTLLSVLHSGLEGLTEVETDPKQSIVS